jgi:hypothetical protein
MCWSNINDNYLQEKKKKERGKRELDNFQIMLGNDQIVFNRQIYKGEFKVIVRGAWQTKLDNGGKV